MDTYADFAPGGGIPDDVISLLVKLAQKARVHYLVLREPDLVLLVPSPRSAVPVWPLAVGIRGWAEPSHLQFNCCQMLLDITRATVEDPHQGLLVEA